MDYTEADNRTRAYERGHRDGLNGAGPKENPFQFPAYLKREWESGRKRGQEWRKSYGCKSRV